MKTKREKQIEVKIQLEKDFLLLCCSELTYAEIAKKMYKSERTIHGIRDNLFLKHDLKNRSGLIMFAVNSGIYQKTEIVTQ